MVVDPGKVRCRSKMTPRANEQQWGDGIGSILRGQRGFCWRQVQPAVPPPGYRERCGVKGNDGLGSRWISVLDTENARRILEQDMTTLIDRKIHRRKALISSSLTTRLANNTQRGTQSPVLALLCGEAVVENLARSAG